MQCNQIHRPMTTQNYFISSSAELIDIAEEKDRNFWASRLGVTCEKLKTAVRATHSLEYQKVKSYLRKKKLANH